MKKQIENIPDLISAGENDTLEFKSSFNTELIETLVAFANTSGGRVIIGVNQKKELTGVSLNSESVQNWVNEIKNKTQPSLTPDFEITFIDNKQVVTLSISEYPVKPVATKGRCFKRIGNSNHLMGIQEVADMHLRTFNTSWDSFYTNQYSIREVSVDKINHFVEQVNHIREIPIGDDPFTVLRKFELIKDNLPSNACFLLFAGNIL